MSVVALSIARMIALTSSPCAQEPVHLRRRYIHRELDRPSVVRMTSLQQLLASVALMMFGVTSPNLTTAAAAAAPGNSGGLTSATIKGETDSRQSGTWRPEVAQVPRRSCAKTEADRGVFGKRALRVYVRSRHMKKL